MHPHSKGPHNTRLVKGHSGQSRSALEWYQCKGLGLHFYFDLGDFFYKEVKVPGRLIQNLFDPPILRGMDSAPFTIKKIHEKIRKLSSEPCKIPSLNIKCMVPNLLETGWSEKRLGLDGLK